VELHNHGVHGSGLLQPPDLNEDNDPEHWIWTRNNWFPDIFADVNINGSNNDNGNNYNHNGTNATNNYNNANDYYNNYSNNMNSSNEHHDNNTHDKDNKTTLTNGANFDLETIDRILRESEPTSDAPDYIASFDGQFIQLSCQAIPPDGSIQDEISSYGADAEGEPKGHKTTHQGNNSDATVNTDGGISISVEELESYIRDLVAEPTSASTSAAAAVSSASFDGQFNHQAHSHPASVTEPSTNTIQPGTNGREPPTPPERALVKRPAPAAKDQSNPKRCRDYRERQKFKGEEQNRELIECLEKQRKLKAEEAALSSLGSSAPRGVIRKIQILDKPFGSFGGNDDINDTTIYIVTKSAPMDASQKITKAAKWRSFFEDFKYEPLLPSDEPKMKRQKSVRNCREKKKAVEALKLRMMTTLNDENIPTLEANIKQLQQDQALLPQQHQQQFQQKYGSPTQAQHPQSQAQPQQQAQVVQSGTSAGVQTITVSQQQPQVVQLQPQQPQPQVIQLQPQQQQQQQPQQPQPQVFQLQPQQQQQQQQAQPHHQTQQPGAVAGPPGGIQILQQITTPTGEIYQIPIQLNAEQLQLIRAQTMGAGSLQPNVIQTAPIQAPIAQPAQTVQTIQLQGGQHVYNIQQQY